MAQWKPGSASMRVSMMMAAMMAALSPASCTPTTGSGSTSTPSSSDSIAIPPPPPPSTAPSSTAASSPPPAAPQGPLASTAGAKRKDCGTQTEDWCPSPPGDPCGKHPDVKSCRADPKCKGMPFRGETFAPCTDDGSGFSTNCVNVGCISR